MVQDRVRRSIRGWLDKGSFATDACHTGPLANRRCSIVIDGWVDLSLFTSVLRARMEPQRRMDGQLNPEVPAKKQKKRI